MTKAAILDENNIVINIVMANPEDIPGSVSADGAAIGDAWDGEKFLRKENSSASLQDAKDALTKQATEKRWECEISGVTLPDGTRVGTTIEDQNRITSVVSNAELAGVATVDFKSASRWVTLSIEQVKGIAVFIARHVQDCFSAERKHHEAIAQLTSLEEVQSYNIDLHWPKYSN